MRRSVGILVLACVTLSVAGKSWGLMITSPKEGDVFHPGDTIILATSAGPDEGDIRKVTFNGDERWALFIYAPGPPYRASLTIPQDFVGNLTLRAAGIVGPISNEISVDSVPVTIRVVLPPDIILVSMRPDPDQVFLRKLPSGSSPNRIRSAETERIAIMGTFSDGVERSISSSSRGTTYETSDQKIATVNAEGLVSAVSPGQATITVKNGEKRVQVPVYVRPPKQ